MGEPPEKMPTSGQANSPSDPTDQWLELLGEALAAPAGDDARRCFKTCFPRKIYARMDKVVNLINFSCKKSGVNKLRSIA